MATTTVINPSLWPQGKHFARRGLEGEEGGGDTGIGGVGRHGEKGGGGRGWRWLSRHSCV